MFLENTKSDPLSLEAKAPYFDFWGGLARKLEDYKCPLAHLMKGLDLKYKLELA